MGARALHQTAPHRRVGIETVACANQVHIRDNGRDMSLPYK
jgi:hypothetical protein